MTPRTNTTTTTTTTNNNKTPRTNTNPSTHSSYNFNDTTDISIVAWLAQYDPTDLPPNLANAFRLGPIQSSLGITQPIVWLANLSCDFSKAYTTIDDPHDVLGPTLGGRRNRENGKRTFPRDFSKAEQLRFDKLQDEYHNLRWRNLLNLGYDPATAATMVGAIKDQHQNLFSPPPLFALSPRMIVTDEEKRQSMRNVLIHYLDGKAEEAERELLEDLEREGSSLLGAVEKNGNNNNNGSGGGASKKNAKKKKAKKKKKQQAKQQQQQQQTVQPSQSTSGTQSQQPQQQQQQPQTIQQAHQKASDQNPLNKEQLKYLREHQQSNNNSHQHQNPENKKPIYSEEDRRIIEDALIRNGLSSTVVSPTSASSAEKIYKESESTHEVTVAPNGGTTVCLGKKKQQKKEDGDGDEEEEVSQQTSASAAAASSPPTTAAALLKSTTLKYEEEVQNYAYAWCCDYCKTATFPTFAEAALHESKCLAFLEWQKENEAKKVDGEGDGGAMVEESANDDEDNGQMAIENDGDYDESGQKKNSNAGGGDGANASDQMMSLPNDKKDDASKPDDAGPVAKLHTPTQSNDDNAGGELDNGQRSDCKQQETRKPLDDTVVRNDPQKDDASDGSAQQTPKGNSSDSSSSSSSSHQEPKECGASDGCNSEESNQDVATGDKHHAPTSCKRNGKKNIGKKSQASDEDDEFCKNNRKKKATSKKVHAASSSSSSSAESFNANGDLAHDEKQSTCKNKGKKKSSGKKAHANPPSSCVEGKEAIATKLPPSLPSSSAKIGDSSESSNNESGVWKPVVPPHQSTKNKSPKKVVAKKKKKTGTNSNNRSAAAALENNATTTQSGSNEKSASSKTKSTKKKPKNGAKGHQKQEEEVVNQVVVELDDNDLQKENVSTRNESHNRVITPMGSASSSSSTNENALLDIGSLSDQDLARIVKPLTIDYDDRVNETALPQPCNDAGQSSILPPLVGQTTESPMLLPQSLPVTTTPATGPPPISSPDSITDNNRLVIASLTSENEILNARNNFLEEQNKSLLATNEALRNKLVSDKQHAVEALQRVQLKAYIADTARDAAVERTAWLENVLANAVVTDTTTANEEAGARQGREDHREGVAMVGNVSIPSSLQRHQQQHYSNNNVQPLPPMPQSMPPMPQSMPPGYHHMQQQQPPQQQQSSASPSATSLLMSNNRLMSSSNGMHPLPGSLHNNLMGHHPPPPSQPSLYYNNQNNQHQNSLGGNGPFPGSPQNSASNNDFWEPPWMRNESPLGASRESVLSRLRRGDHAA